MSAKYCYYHECFFNELRDGELIHCSDEGRLCDECPCWDFMEESHE